MTKAKPIAAVCVLMLTATAALARPVHRTSQAEEVVPSSAALDAVTNVTWRHFETVYKDGGMAGLVQAVRGCYNFHDGQRSTVMRCLQLDYFAHEADVAGSDQLAASEDQKADLRTPYFSDELMRARRQTYTSQLAGDEADSLSAALLIHAQNKIKAELGSSPAQ